MQILNRIRNPWIVGIGFPAIALGLQLLAWQWISPYVWFFFYPAVLFAAWLCGLRGALVATPLSVVLVWYIFMPERYTFEIDSLASGLTLAMFMGLGLLFGVAQERIRRVDTKELSRAETMLDNLFEQSLVGVALFDRSGNSLYVNPEWLHIFGYDSADEIVGKLKNVDMVAPAARPKLKQVMQQRLSGQQPRSAFSIEGIRRDGSRVWVSAYGSAFETEGETASLVVALDITDRVHAEEELLATTERFHFAEEAAGVGVFEWDIATDILTWDDEMKALYGLSPSDPAPDYEQWKRLLHPDDSQQVMDVLDAAIAGTAPYDVRFRIKLDSGELRYLKGSGIVFRNDAGTPARMVGANYDITREAVAETALIASEARFRAFMDSAPAVSWMQDADGRILWVNHMFRRMWGERDYTKLKIADFQPPDVAARLREQDLQVMAGEGPIIRRNAANGPHGEPMHWHTARFAFEDADGRTIVGATSINVTAEVESQRRVEALLKTLEERVELRTAELASANRELEDANRELESFSYAVSHDLRGPLRAMSGFASILAEDYDDALDDEGRSHLARIVDASTEMSVLIDGLLQLSRTTRADLTRAQVDVSRMTAEQWEYLRLDEPLRSIELTIEPGIELNADPFMTQVLLNNLLGNAWKYTSKTDSPKVSITSAELEGQPAVRICDNGAGFDPAHAARLFEPFQRLHTQDEFPGVGVGLATCVRIVRRHKGRITAESTPGRGACFTFSLGPAVAPSEHQIAPA